jgi:DNA primase
MLFPEELISQIRDENDIVEVISSYISLKRGGANYKGLCPFHSEKTPSFMVSPAKQIFHCFGCGEGGDVFSFLMKKENMPFPEAIRTLAERCGRRLPANEGPLEDPVRQKEKKRIFEINGTALTFFLGNRERSEGALAYLDRRGVSEAAVAQFQLGYAPDSWDALYKHLRDEGFREAEMERAGLVLPRKRGKGYYDRFRNRIIFPIVDIYDRVLGFGGRVLDESTPKYLNSPETPVFEKGSNLYGLNVAYEAIRRQDYALLVEGYMDVITAHQQGIKNALATLGTALTQGHLRRLRRYTRNLALFFDSDDAGFKAAERCFDLCVPEGMKIKVGKLAPGEDPDSFLRKSGKKGFSEKMSQAKPIMDFMIHQVMGNRVPEALEGKVDTVARLKPLLAVIPDPIEQELYIKEVASLVGIEPSTLQQGVRSIGSKTSRRQNEPKGESRSVRTEIPPMEGKFLGLMLSYPKLIPELRDKVDADDFTHVGLRAAVCGLMALPEESLSRNAVHNLILATDRNLEEAVARISFEGEKDPSFDLMAEAEGFISRLRLNRLRYEQKELQAKIRSAEEQGDHEAVKALLEQLDMDRKEIEQITNLQQKISAEGRNGRAWQ